MKPEFAKDILVREQRFGSRRHENGARMLVIFATKQPQSHLILRRHFFEAQATSVNL